MSTAIARTQDAGPIGTVKALLEKQMGNIEKVLPQHMTAERFTRIALSCVARDNKLLECSAHSLARSIIQAAELGLEVTSALGEGYLVPFRRKTNNGFEMQATFIPGYKGLVALARRSGILSSMSARVVHERDKFRVLLGTEERIDHEPFIGQDAGPVIAAYAVARLSDGTICFDLMATHEIELVRSRSRAGNGGPWVTDWEEMAKKTVVRRLTKLLPMSVQMATAMSLEDAEPDSEQPKPSFGDKVKAALTIDLPSDEVPEAEVVEG